MVQKLKDEKETQERQYEVEFREFEEMANQKVVQLEEYYVQQLQMKEAQVNNLYAQMQQLQQQQMVPSNGVGGRNPLGAEEKQVMVDEIANLKKDVESRKESVTRLQQENGRLSGMVNKLNYEQKHDRDQLRALQDRNTTNDQKLSAYNASFVDLAQQLKAMSDDIKEMRKGKDKMKKKCDKLEKQKRKLKQEVKELEQKLKNTEAVTRDLVMVKHRMKAESEKWAEQKVQYDDKNRKLQQDMDQMVRKKIEGINKYNVEMNNLRANIKTLQKRIVAAELENDRLRETDSQSVVASVSGWFGTKK